MCVWFNFFNAPYMNINPSFKMCPFRWQCCVIGLTTYHNWIVFKHSSFLVLLVPCTSPGKDSQCFLWSLSHISFHSNFYWDAASCFRSYERTSESVFCQLMGSFITHNIIMTNCPYQLNYGVFGQFFKLLIAVSDQLWVNFVIVKCFNCCVALW
jgi:hypothetical protein